MTATSSAPMADYRATLYVSRETAGEMERLCLSAHCDLRAGGVEFDSEVRFADGMRMAIQVCVPCAPSSESCWTQGVLFTPDGVEAGCTDVGEYWVSDGRKWYCADVVATEESSNA